jgi:hypothetical protein
MSNLRFAFRQLCKSPGFTLTAVLTLALGIGANTAIFSVINSVLLRPLPYPRSEQLLVAWDSNAGKSVDHSSLSPAKLADLRAQTRSFQSLAGYYVADQNLVLPNEIESLSAALTTGPFFQTLGIAPLLGRSFRDADDKKHLRFPGRFQSERPTTIVGVVSAIHHAGLDRAPVAEMYFPYQQNPWPSQAIVVRTANAPEEMIATLQRVLLGIDPTQAAFDIRTMEQRLDRSVAERRFNMRVLTLFALIALALAAVGIYGVISYDVSQRTREIGIRMALGADRVSVHRLVIGRGFRLAILGVLVGIGAALTTRKFLASLLFGIGASDSFTIFASGSFVLLIALFACWIPARRASGISPMEALRVE